MAPNDFIHDSSPAPAPIHQGTFSHRPNDVLSRIASKLSVPVSSLSTLVIRPETHHLYSAVLEYAALSDPLDPDTTYPLFVNGVRMRQEVNDADFLSSSRRLSELMNIFPDRHRRLTGGAGLRAKEVPVPSFELDIGEATIVWPPPPHLQAAYLNELRYSTRKSSSGSEHPASKDGDPQTDTDEADGLVGRRVIYVSHYSVGEPKQSDHRMVTYRELLLVSPDGSKLLRAFAADICQWKIDKEYYQGDGSKFALYRYKTSSCGPGNWVSEGQKRARAPSSVILPDGQMKAILNDVQNFVKPQTREWYLSHGLPHRRSYLFYGPPGTGKTSTIRVIGSMCRLNCCFLSMTTAGFSNQSLGDALSQIPSNALIVLEDVDALFNEDRKNQDAPSLTFSGLLNALDGLISVEGVVTVMTTNFIDKLDKALVRGGRVDRRFHFARPGTDQVRDLFLSFYPDAKKATVKEFVDAVFERREGSECRSMATLQQLFIDQKDNSAEECARSVPSFFDRYFPNGSITKESEKRMMQGYL